MKYIPTYCCEERKSMIENYYKQQVGNGLPAFVGRKYQRGHGIGNMLSGLMKSAIPLLKKSGKSVGKHLLSAGMNIATDVLSGKNIKESSKKRLKAGGRNAIRELKSQHGSTSRHRLKNAASPGIRQLKTVRKKGRTLSKSNKRGLLFPDVFSND